MHPNPALAPLVATIAVCTPSKIGAVLTKFIRFALQVRPNSVHFVVQLSPGIVFTQLTVETQGGVEATSRVKPLPQTQPEALLNLPSLVALVDPHDLQMGFVESDAS